MEGCVGLQAYATDCRIKLLEPSRRSDKGAARSECRNKMRDAAGGLLPNFVGGGAIVSLPVRTTANEIWQQTSGRVTHFVAALGTSGTFVGTTRRLKELNPAIRCVSLQPDASFHGLEGWKHMPTAIRPAIYDDTLADENLAISTEEAYKLVKRLAREEGLLVSPSSAAALLGCFQVAPGIPKYASAAIVTG